MKVPRTPPSRTRAGLGLKITSIGETPARRYYPLAAYLPTAPPREKRSGPDPKPSSNLVSYVWCTNGSMLGTIFLSASGVVKRSPPALVAASHPRASSVFSRPALAASAPSASKKTAVTFRLPCTLSSSSVAPRRFATASPVGDVRAPREVEAERRAPWRRPCGVVVAPQKVEEGELVARHAHRRVCVTARRRLRAERAATRGLKRRRGSRRRWSTPLRLRARRPAAVARRSCG